MVAALIMLVMILAFAAKTALAPLWGRRPGG
jgi:hypothetical protein